MTHKTDGIIFKLADESSFRQLFDRYYVTLCMFANEYVCDDLLAADIVQDCFVKLWQSRDGFTYIHQIKSFLYTSVRNRSLNELEHSKVKSEYARKVMDSHKDAFFHDKVIVEETYRILQEAIDSLPPGMRSIILLTLEGKTNQEIAEELSVSKGNRTLPKEDRLPQAARLSEGLLFPALLLCDFFLKRYTLFTGSPVILL